MEHGIQFLRLPEGHSQRYARNRPRLPVQFLAEVPRCRNAVGGDWFSLEFHDVGRGRLVLPDGLRDVRDFRLPGLGSYLQTAASAGDTQAILWGVAVMVAVIILLDQVVWRPVIAWAEKFKLEQIESAESPGSWLLELIRHSRLVSRFRKKAIPRLSEALSQRFARNRVMVCSEQHRLV